jgi:hypothetical protein
MAFPPRLWLPGPESTGPSMARATRNCPSSRIGVPRSCGQRPQRGPCGLHALAHCSGCGLRAARHRSRLIVVDASQSLASVLPGLTGRVSRPSGALRPAVVGLGAPPAFGRVSRPVHRLPGLRPSASCAPSGRRPSASCPPSGLRPSASCAPSGRRPSASCPRSGLRPSASRASPPAFGRRRVALPPVVAGAAILRGRARRGCAALPILCWGKCAGLRRDRPRGPAVPCRGG